MSTIISDRLQVEDLARGATFFGTGGGGDPMEGIKALMDEVEQGKKISLIDVRDLGDDVFIASPYLMGSIAPTTDEKRQEISMASRLSKKSYDFKTMMANSVKELASYTGKKISAVVPSELGGAAALTAIAAGSSLNMPVVDGDFSGRAVPEICQTTPFLTDKLIYPTACVDEFGDVCIIKNAISAEVAERIGKSLSVALFGVTAQCDSLMSGKEAQDTIIPGTISRCLEVGAFIRKCREGQQNVVDSLAKEVGGWVLFKGTVSAKEPEDRDGYYWGTHTLNGVDEFSGQTFKIWFKNENHISWKDDKPFVTSPDLITVVDLETGEPITNTVLKVTDRVGVIGTKAKDIMRTSKGVAVFGPRHFGFDFDYRPIEEAVK